MPKDIFQFRITNGVSYLYVSDTILGVPVVSPSADPVNLSQSVVDWDKLQLQYKRDKKYHGVFRKYGPDKVRFSNDGAAILRYLANTQGVEAKGFLEVMKLNSTDQQYYSLGQWAMDFSTPYSSQQLYADIGLMDGGLSALLAAYESASVNHRGQLRLSNPAVGDYANDNIRQRPYGRGCITWHSLRKSGR